MQSILYRAAQRAFQQGRTEREFAEAAERHETVFWLCVLAGVLLWWLADRQLAAIPIAVAVWCAYRWILDRQIQRHIASCKHPAPESSGSADGAKQRRI
ncbi:MAG: hypothetical protein ABW034_17795 [Steroidobacteraceae bacterium]